jgi:glycosyltransferase involved in cell wall biosynthesis
MNSTSANCKVSVSITTYNHRAYIAQAVDGALQQETDFEYEILIGEDDSSDGTREIVLDYQQRYPDKIRLFLNDRKNVIYIGGRATGRWNLVNNLRQAQGQYIACLDGDDYWTSPHKLQRQADLLDAHPDLALCFHPIERHYDEEYEALKTSRKRPRQARYTMEDLLRGNFVATCSVMYRNGLYADFPQWFFTIPFADWPLHILHALHGDIGVINEVMAVHRTHSGSTWSPGSKLARRKDVVTTLEILWENLPVEYRPTLQESLARGHWSVLGALLREGDYRAMGSCARELLAQDKVPKSTLARTGLSMWLSRTASALGHGAP